MSDPPIRSGNGLIDGLFDLCVQFLLWLADVLGVSYNTVNIWVFCVLWPAFTLALIVLVVRQRLKIRNLEQAIRNRSGCETASAPNNIRGEEAGK
jgi:hypothetical protein